jgi:hypothetical protein
MSRHHSPSVFARREIDQEKAIQFDANCQTQTISTDQEVQSTVNMYEKWTQTKEQQPQVASSRLEELNKISTEHVYAQKPLKRDIKRGSSNKIKKKSVISKASIKKTADISNISPDIVFSPGDKRTSSKLHSSTMKKSNTITSSIVQRSSQIGASNRFLYRGNEEFHNTYGRPSMPQRTNLEAIGGELFVGASKSKSLKTKKDKN